MLDIKEAIKDNENYGYEDLGLLSLPRFIDSVGIHIKLIVCFFHSINVIFVISESAKTQWPTRNKNKIPRIFLTGNSIKRK